MSEGKMQHSRAREAAAEWVPIGDLVTWADNPRVNSGKPVDAVAASLSKFGWGAPIVARSETREVIAGHTRLKAAAKLGMDMVPVRFVDLSERDAHLLALADNRVGEFAQWDNVSVASILSEYSLEDAELAGWSSYDLEKLADECPDFGPLEEDAPSLDETDAKRCPHCDGVL